MLPLSLWGWLFVGLDFHLAVGHSCQLANALGILFIWVDGRLRLSPVRCVHWPLDFLNLQWLPGFSTGRAAIISLPGLNIALRCQVLLNLQLLDLRCVLRARQRDRLAEETLLADLRLGFKLRVIALVRVKQGGLFFVLLDCGTIVRLRRLTVLEVTVILLDNVQDLRET